MSNINVTFYFKSLSNQMLVAQAHPFEIYILYNPAVKPSGRWWVVSDKGIEHYNTAEQALSAFYNTYTNADPTPKLMRKSSSAKLKKAKVKVADVFKQAASSSDEWISDPESLVLPASRNLWAITSDGKHVARLFEDSDFPLEV